MCISTDRDMYYVDSCRRGVHSAREGDGGLREVRQIDMRTTWERGYEERLEARALNFLFGPDKPYHG